MQHYNKKYLSFTPGPVQMHEEILALGALQPPYFRNQAFSELVLEIERMLIELSDASEDSKVLLLSSSGTGAMECAISNLISENESSLIINAGGFGHRFVEIYEALDLPYTELKLELGDCVQEETTKEIKPGHFDSIVYNHHETTTGALHDINAIGEIAASGNTLHIVDGISSFLCDDLSFKKNNIDVLILSSQKALALPPGLSILILSPLAVSKIVNRASSNPSYYFELKSYLENSKRGQTPFTPPVSIIMQLYERLMVLQRDGYQASVLRTKGFANYFRNKLQSLPFSIFPKIPSNAITTVDCGEAMNAINIVNYAYNMHDIYLTPNGGEMSDRIFRVSHMGKQNESELDKLCDVLQQYVDEGMK